MGRLFLWVERVGQRGGWWPDSEDFPHPTFLRCLSASASGKQHLMRELRVIDAVASLIKFTLSSESYNLDHLLQISPITRAVQLAYRLLTLLVKVREGMAQEDDWRPSDAFWA